jgi:hypothetical protein
VEVHRRRWVVDGHDFAISINLILSISSNSLDNVRPVQETVGIPDATFIGGARHWRRWITARDVGTVNLELNVIDGKTKITGNIGRDGFGAVDRCASGGRHKGNGWRRRLNGTKHRIHPVTARQVGLIREPGSTVVVVCSITAITGNVIILQSG